MRYFLSNYENKVVIDMVSLDSQILFVTACIGPLL